MFSTIITPKFGDIDGLGHVNNTVMPGWFEQARNPIYRFFNPEFDFKNWNLILAHYEVDFISQMFYGEDITIQSWILRVGRSSFDVYQEAWQGDRLGSKGKTVLVYFDFKKQKSQVIPKDIKIELEKHLIENVEHLMS